MRLCGFRMLLAVLCCYAVPMLLFRRMGHTQECRTADQDRLGQASCCLKNVAANTLSHHDA
jgi:hypothetical protein